ncbi:unnamed protein product [Mesocestoides corti]|uniref:Uncharacterized protein n=2 Tax=Mesocestoides corti TaxID=53468 RepID=A0A0R3UAX0_MESCO|nr:unnamed protein product [Mesocestoides corti]
MKKLTNHDRLIETGRERLQQKLQERRMAAMAAKTDQERDRVNAILSKQDDVEQGVDRRKADMQRKLMDRIEQEKQQRADGKPLNTFYPPPPPTVLEDN